MTESLKLSHRSDTRSHLAAHGGRWGWTQPGAWSSQQAGAVARRKSSQLRRPGDRSHWHGRCHAAGSSGGSNLGSSAVRHPRAGCVHGYVMAKKKGEAAAAWRAAGGAAALDPATGQPQPFVGVTVATAGGKSWPLRPEQRQELVAWLGGAWDTDWLRVEGGVPVGFVTQTGEVDLLALPSTAPPKCKIPKAAAAATASGGSIKPAIAKKKPAAKKQAVPKGGKKKTKAASASAAAAAAAPPSPPAPERLSSDQRGQLIVALRAPGGAAAGSLTDALPFSTHSLLELSLAESLGAPGAAARIAADTAFLAGLGSLTALDLSADIREVMHAGELGSAQLQPSDVFAILEAMPPTLTALALPDSLGDFVGDGYGEGLGAALGKMAGARRAAATRPHRPLS